MALPQGINFRTTSGYVTDGADEYGETAVSLNYPTTTPQGNTVGWESTSAGVTQDTRDRDNANDRRLAGFAFDDAGGRWMEYRVDLPASGIYNMRIAMGEALSASGTQYFEVRDTSTQLGTTTTTTTSAAQKFCDATGTEYSNTAWPGSNSPISLTFSTTICRVRFGASSGTFRAAHLYIESGVNPVAGCAFAGQFDVGMVAAGWF